MPDFKTRMRLGFGSVDTELDAHVIYAYRPGLPAQREPPLPPEPADADILGIRCEDYMGSLLPLSLIDDVLIAELREMAVRHAQGEKP